MAVKLLGRNELNVFFDKIQPRFHIGKQVEQFVPQSGQWSGQAAGQLRQGNVQFAFAVGVDHAQHGFRLRQIQSPREKRTHGELARFGHASARRTDRRQGRLQQRWRADGVQFGSRLSRVASAAGPQVEIARQLANG